MRCRELLALLALVACGGDDAALPDDDPRTLRYPAERLPWAAAPETNAPTGLVSEDVTGHSYQVLQPRAVVLGYGTGLDARVVAIIPFADTGTLSIAFAGVDHPWERVPVAALTADAIGALDAVVDATNTVHLFVREKAVPGRLRYFQWREGGAVVERAPTPAVPNAIAVRYAASCTDVSTAIDHDGRPAVTFTVHTLSDGPAVYLARQDAGGAWTTQQIASSYPVMNQPLLVEAGCRTLLRTDDAGYLRFATLRRTLPSSFSTDEELRWNLPKTTFNGAETVDGRFVPTTGVADDSAGTDDYAYSGLFDLHVDTLGVLWPSPYATSFGLAVAASLADPIVVPKRDNRDRGAVVSGALHVDDCRELTQTVDATLTPFNPRWGYGPCPRSASPPVIARGAALVEPVHVVWTRGSLPFSAGLCVDAEGTIAICGPTLQVPEPRPEGGVCRPTPDDMLPSLTARSVQPGAEVAVGSTWMLEAEPNPDGQSWVLVDLDTIHRELSSEDIPARVLVNNGEPAAAVLQAGHRYRATLNPDLLTAYIDDRRTCAYAWLYPLADRGSPEITFTAIGERPIDPRSVRPALECDRTGGTRASDGACEVEATVSYVDGWYDLVAPYSGTLVVGAGTGSVSVDGQPYDRVEWNTESNRMQWRFLAPVDTTEVYTLTPPASVGDYWGGPGPDPATSTIRLRFPLPALRVISSTVMDGATGVALDVELGFELSLVTSLGPVRFGPTGGTLADIAPQQVTTTAWRVPHAPLQPGTSYTLEVPDLVPVYRLQFTTGL